MPANRHRDTGVPDDPPPPDRRPLPSPRRDRIPAPARSDSSDVLLILSCPTMGRDSSTGHGPGANTDVVILGTVTPRLKPQFLHASEVDRVAHVFGFANRKHAPAFVIHRVGGVDFECHRMSHGAEELRAARRTEDDR